MFQRRLRLMLLYVITFFVHFHGSFIHLFCCRVLPCTVQPFPCETNGTLQSRKRGQRAYTLLPCDTLHAAQKDSISTYPNTLSFLHQLGMCMPSTPLKSSKWLGVIFTILYGHKIILRSKIFIHAQILFLTFKWAIGIILVNN